MTPMLGIMASQISGHLVTGAFDSIATVAVGVGGSSTITFSSIPSTYTHLQIRGIVRDNRAVSTDQDMKMTFNSDTAANYSSHALYGSGASAASSSEVSSNYALIGSSIGDSALASTFGVVVCDILDYTNTNKYKTTRSLSGFDLNGAGYVYLNSGNWRNTAAITQIDVTPYSATAFKQYSHFALYGIKG